MVADYVELLYEPTAARTNPLSADGYAGAALAAWKQRVARRGTACTSTGSRATTPPPSSAGPGPWRRWWRWATLAADDVDVQLLHGPVGQGDELDRAHGRRRCRAAGAADDDHARYGRLVLPASAGRYGFTVRIVPRHPDLVGSSELGLAAWA